MSTKLTLGLLAVALCGGCDDGNQYCGAIAPNVTLRIVDQITGDQLGARFSFGTFQGQLLCRAAYDSEGCPVVNFALIGKDEVTVSRGGYQDVMLSLDGGITHEAC